MKRQLKQEIYKICHEILKIDIDSNDIIIGNPPGDSMGDYTSNCAMTAAAKSKGSYKARELAEKIKEYLEKSQLSSSFLRIEIAGPGFINIFISHKYLIEQAFNTELNIQNKQHNSKKVLIEFLQPNTNKPLHIGHIRNAAYGQALVNLNYTSGRNVISANLNNDRGIHIIKSMYGYLRYGRVDQAAPNNASYSDLVNTWIDHKEQWMTPESAGLKEDHFVGKYYILGNTDYESSENDEAQVENNPSSEMQKMLIAWESGDKSVRSLWEAMNGWFYAGLKKSLAKMQLSSPNNPEKFFDKEWYESEIYKSGKEIIIENIGNGVIEEHDDGHVEANLEKYNLPNIVLLRKNKTSLYITQDIELMRMRAKDDKIDQIIILTANEQNLRFQQLFAICESLEISDRKNMVHIGYGTVRTPEGKMSSRKGNVINADDLLEEIELRAKEKINEEKNAYIEEEKVKISSQVAIGALKYGLLKFNALSNIAFDIETNISFEGDTGPYIQYTHARANSVIVKFNELFKDEDSKHIESEGVIDLSDEELTLLKHLQKYEDVIALSTEQNSPNYLCDYLHQLSQRFNHFYTVRQIVGENNSVKRALRIAVTKKTKNILKHGLWVLGISSPDKM